MEPNISGEPVKPIVYISKCLEHASCRYDGEMIRHSFIKKLQEFVTFNPVCPEVEIGLGIPRDPCRIVLVKEKTELFLPATGEFITEKMERFCQNLGNTIADVDGFILKNRSPSCGINDVKMYLGTHKSAASKRGSGFWGEVVQTQFPGYPLEDEGRLNNFFLREHFLTSLYAMARFRKVRKQGRSNTLLQFQRTHKLLFMAYNQAGSRRLGAICGNQSGFEFSQVLEQYFEEMRKIFIKPPRASSMINALMHAFGGISKGLSAAERKYFINTIEEYRDERIPLSTVLHLLRGWAIRFDNQYLNEQVLLDPFPSELMDMTNTGKSRF